MSTFTFDLPSRSSLSSSSAFQCHTPPIGSTGKKPAFSPLRRSPPSASLSLLSISPALSLNEELDLYGPSDALSSGAGFLLEMNRRRTKSKNPRMTKKERAVILADRKKHPVKRKVPTKLLLQNALDLVDESESPESQDSE